MEGPCPNCHSTKDVAYGFNGNEFVIYCMACAAPNGQATYLIAVKTTNRVRSKELAVAAWNRLTSKGL